MTTNDFPLPWNCIKKYSRGLEMASRAFFFVVKVFARDLNLETADFFLQHSGLFHANLDDSLQMNWPSFHSWLNQWPWVFISIEIHCVSPPETESAAWGKNISLLPIVICDCHQKGTVRCLCNAIWNFTLK